MTSNDVEIILGLSLEEMEALSSILKKVQDGIKRAGDSDLKALKYVEQVVCSFFKVPTIELYEGKSNRVNMYCLSIICFILKEHYKMHPSRLGAVYGLHRTSVIHHIKKMKRMISTDKDYREVYNAVWLIIQKGE